MSDQRGPRDTIDPRRRRVLAGFAGSAGVAALGPGVVTALAAEVAETLAGLGNFALNDARSLLAVSRTLFPHDFLADDFYVRGVARLDSMADEADTAALIAQGLSGLPDDFVTLEQAAREAALAPLSDSAFFALVRRVTVDAIYRSPDVWPHFDYPGPSLPFGGWVNKQLVDIDWLPEV